MPAFFYEHNASAGLREQLYRAQKSRAFFELIAAADRRLSVSPEATEAAIAALQSSLDITIPVSLAGFWCMASGVRMRHDCIVFTPDEVLASTESMLSYNIPGADRYFYIGETGDGDMFGYSRDCDLSSEDPVLLWSHETHEVELCGNIWKYVADHVSWRVVHMRDE